MAHRDLQPIRSTSPTLYWPWLDTLAITITIGLVLALIPMAIIVRAVAVALGDLCRLAVDSFRRGQRW